MKTAYGKDFLAATVSCILMATLAGCSSAPASTSTQVQVPQIQVPIPTTAAEVPGPVSGSAMTKDYVQMLGRTAYFWGYPLVATSNRRAAFAKAPERILLGGAIPMAPVGYNTMLNDYVKPDEDFVVCPNQDVVYGGGFTALDKEPTVFQVPDFGNRFWVYPMYDTRTDEIAKVGKQYGTKPGFYMIVGRNWKGKVPSGITAVVYSPTDLVFAVPRIQLDDTAEDRKAIQTPLSQVMFYPLSQYDGKMKSIDWSKIPSVPVPAGPPNKWVNPETYFDDLPVVMAQVPPLPGEEALYGSIQSVFKAAATDPATKKALVESFVAADKELVDPLLQWRYNGVSAGNGWTTLRNGARWGTDYLTRTAVAKSNIYVNVPPEAKYFYNDNDNAGTQLDGRNRYAVTFAKGQLPPVKGFWSMTLYNDRHFFNPNPLRVYSLGTKNKNLRYNPDGSLTLYASAASPGKDKEANWLPAPNGTFSLYIRGYWADKALLDGTWQPPAIAKVK
jgi:hypothetical protein